MARFKVQLASTKRLLSLDAGDKVDGWRIVETIPGSPHAIIEFPDDWDASRVDQEMGRLESAGTIVNDGRGLPRSRIDWLGYVSPTATFTAAALRNPRFSSQSSTR